MSTLLFTGFPGFLGVQLLPRVLSRLPNSTVTCLIQSNFADLATRQLEELVEANPDLAGRIDLVTGDITVPGLGLDDPTALAAGVTEVWHLAAVYDLSVPRDVAMRVNVEGTRNVLDFAERADSLQRFHYVSTCYVSGRYAGAFGEDDLDVGQQFNNYYEETKFLAEVEVQTRRDQGMPTTIYRPSVVVGDSTTGQTQKYDGPYYALQLLLRQGRWAVMPTVGDPTLHRFNIVPSDFVIEAIATLSATDRSSGRVYNLADPRPHRGRALRHYGRRRRVPNDPGSAAGRSGPVRDRPRARGAQPAAHSFQHHRLPQPPHLLPHCQPGRPRRHRGGLSPG